MLRTTRPCTITWLPVSELGFKSTGFMSVWGGMPQASACTAWARPISPPSGVTAELSAMFWDLKGATEMPRRFRMRQNPAQMIDFPTSEPVPQNIRARGSGREAGTGVTGDSAACTPGRLLLPSLA